DQGKYAEAETILRDCVRIRVQKLPNDWLTFSAQSLLGNALLGQKKYSEAEPLLLRGNDGLILHRAKIPADEKRRLVEALERLVRLYDEWGKPDQAATWRKKLEAAK